MPSIEIVSRDPVPAQPRILFIAPNRIGDAVLATGVLDHLLSQMPGAAVTVAGGPASLPVFGGVPGLEKAVLMRKRRFGLHWLALWRRAVLKRWTVVVDMRRSALSWVVWTGVRLIPEKGSRDTHRVVEAGAMLGLADAPPPPRVWLRQPHREAADRLVPGAPGPILAVGPTANWGGKMWPGERFAELIGRLTASDGILPEARVMVLGGPDERFQANPVLTAIPRERRIDLVGKADLLTVAACLEKADFYVGNDSGLMHLAAAMGTPTLGLFGPSDERAYGPWGDRCASTRTPESLDAIVAKPGYDHTSNETHMGSLDVHTVEVAARALWARVSAEGAAR